MRLALLGTGMIVEEVLPVLREIKGIELVAVLSTPRSLEKAQALCERYDMEQATSDYQTILANDKVDTIYIGTPNHTHYAYAKEALLAGKHVICEKPFTLHKADLEDLAALAKEKGLILLEAITNQYLPNTKAIKEHLQELGEVKIVECNYSQYSSRYDAFKQGHIAPAFNPEMGGGALRDLNIYNIHLVVGLFGAPKTVFYLPNIERQVDTSGVLVMDYEGFKCICIGAKDCSADITSTIQGNKGTITILGPTNSLPQITVTHRDSPAKIINDNGDYHRMHAEFEVFEAIIAQNDLKKAHKQLEHSLLVMDVLDKAQESLKG